MSRDSTQDLAVFPDWRQMERIDVLDARELDRLPFGAIQLDAEGNVLKYNRTESSISGLRPGEVIGKNFFTEVAPCTNVREFAGRFREGFAKKDLNAVFPYRFNFKMDPTNVWVRLFYSASTESAWVFVSVRRESEGA